MTNSILLSPDQHHANVKLSLLTLKLECYTSATTYWGETVKCTFTSATAYVPKGCRDGYVNPITNLCQSRCPTSFYGVVTYNWRQHVESSSCSACPTSCYECIDGTNCLSCKKGYYLLLTSSAVSYGTCTIKTAGPFTSTIYVDA